MKFEETQRFKQVWIWITIIFVGLIPIGIFGIGLYQQVIRRHPFGNHPMSDNGLIISFFLIVVLFLFLLLLFGSLRLITVINETGISFRFFPFHLKYHLIHWDEIEKYEVVKYNPIRDYGGWGIRCGKKGKAYNVSGDKGLELILKNGKRLLIGTQMEKEMKDYLKNRR